MPKYIAKHRRTGNDDRLRVVGGEDVDGRVKGHHVGVDVGVVARHVGELLVDGGLHALEARDPGPATPCGRPAAKARRNQAGRPQFRELLLRLLVGSQRQTALDQRRNAHAAPKKGGGRRSGILRTRGARSFDASDMSICVTTHRNPQPRTPRHATHLPEVSMQKTTLWESATPDTSATGAGVMM